MRISAIGVDALGAEFPVFVVCYRNDDRVVDVLFRRLDQIDAIFPLGLRGNDPGVGDVDVAR